VIEFSMLMCAFAAFLPRPSVLAQQSRPINDDHTSSTATTHDLPPDGQSLACSCSDVAKLQDRSQKLKGIELLIAHTVESTTAATPATQHAWNALQGQIRGYLQALDAEGLTTFPDTSLFNENTDPFRGAQETSAGACMDQDFAAHQAEHDASCRAGNWTWQASRTDSAMLQEEAVAVQKEMAWISETIKKLGCGTQPGSPEATGPDSPPPAQPNAAACPQFMVIVQNVTASTMNVPGLNAGSSRSLNNGQGVPILLTFHPDGTFEGAGSGADSGTARGVTTAEVVNSQFGHMQAMTASGSIRPGSCATQPCEPDVMHLVLVGGPSQQMTQAQARGAVNRDLAQTTATNAAAVEFDLPAYLGASAQKTFISSPMLNSYMTVNLVQGNNERVALPAGRSVRYELEHCKSGSRTPTEGGNGGAGIVVPGVELHP